MEQPPNPTATPSSSSQSKDTSTTTSNNGGAKQKMKLPTPQELISHYESQGLETHEASIRVIDDLRHMLYRVIASSSGARSKDKFMADSSRKLDTANTRLAILEMKLDSKPGFPETFSLGIASAAAFRGISLVWPHVVGIWRSVTGSTKSPP